MWRAFPMPRSFGWVRLLRLRRKCSSCRRTHFTKICTSYGSYLRGAAMASRVSEFHAQRSLPLVCLEIQVVLWTITMLNSWGHALPDSPFLPISPSPSNTFRPLLRSHIHKLLSPPHLLRRLLRLHEAGQQKVLHKLVSPPHLAAKIVIVRTHTDR